MLRLYTVKNREAHCWNWSVTFRRCYWIPFVFVTFAIFICFHIWHVVDQFLHEISAYALFACSFASFLTSYQYFITTKRKVTSKWKICFSNILAPLNFLSSVHVWWCTFIPYICSALNFIESSICHISLIKLYPMRWMYFTLLLHITVCLSL